nr:unnamed protein product [Callosobruchus chinensis]
MSKAIQEVTSAIMNAMAEQWVRFPRTDGDKNDIKEKFMEATHFPGVIGAVDCTHVEIAQPPVEEHNYINRKGYHSKNIQIICDYELRIVNINARFPGATHDAFIWRNSCHNDNRLIILGDRTSWLLGDSGYPQEPWLMTPIINPVPGSPESRYSEAHIQARNCVERCIGVLKGRFLCLSKILRYSPQKVGTIANVCAILHNICIAGRLEADFNIPQPLAPQQVPLHVLQDNVPHRDGNNIRQNIIQMYFTNVS